MLSHSVIVQEYDDKLYGIEADDDNSGQTFHQHKLLWLRPTVFPPYEDGETERRQALNIDQRRQYFVVYIGEEHF